LRTVRVTRYVTPLREGGSLPAIVEADDDGMYVLKFRGAGQGPKALIAELVSGDSAGLNLALDYLPSSVMFDPIVEKPGADLASRIVWFDAYVTNVDRTPRNTNMLMWHRRLWLIDHGATLFFHHAPGWTAESRRAREPFALIKTHVLLTKASQLAQVDAGMAALLTPDAIERIVSLIPEIWLEDGPSERAAYRDYLVERLTAPRAFVEEAIRAR
jgi:hypothetical protein